MTELFTLPNLITLGLLVILQAVLGFDNLLYISLESKRAPAERQAFVRRMGIGVAIVLRIVLLVVLVNLVKYVQEPFWSPHHEGIFEATFNLHAVIVLIGGAFILYTAIKEILHMMTLEEEHEHAAKPRSVANVITWIVIMNLVFSFDSILSAMALTDVVPVMAAAIVISGILMILLADHVSTFLQKNRMYEVLGLFVLFVVGIMLVTEGGHLAHLTLGGQKVEAMSKTTFYFVIAVMVLVDIVQGRYQKKLMAMKAKKHPITDAA
jgi:predicted tellurium resistance membrane protein TerC